MSDLISRSALVEKLIKRFRDIDRGRAWRNEYMPIHDAIRLDEIENLQSIALDIEPVDAVEVVRCRECIYRGARDLCPMCVRAYQLDKAGYLDCTVDDGFCHMGAKVDAKEDE